MTNYENHSLPVVLREATAGATPESALVIRELTALTSLRFKDPALYQSMVELGRSYTEPLTLILNEQGESVDDDSLALRRRNVEGYGRAVVFGYCPHCLASCFTYPDGRRLTWPALDHHECAGSRPVVPTPEPGKSHRRQPAPRERITW